MHRQQQSIPTLLAEARSQTPVAVRLRTGEIDFRDGPRLTTLARRIGLQSYRGYSQGTYDLPDGSQSRRALFVYFDAEQDAARFSAQLTCAPWNQVYIEMPLEGPVGLAALTPVKSLY